MKLNINKTALLRFINSLNKLDDTKRFFRSQSTLPLYLQDVLVGLLLSDGHLEKSSPTSFARLSVSFGAKHRDYLILLYELFEMYTNTPPKAITVNNNRTKTTHEILKFNTVSLPQLLLYHDLFYKLRDNKLIKVIPNNINDYMSPVTLAHLIMGDGNLKTQDKIIRIYTNSFTKTEVELLALSIESKLGIKAKTVHDRNNQYILSISKNQLHLLQELLKDHMHPSMLYKLDLESNVGLNNQELLKNVKSIFSKDNIDLSK